MELLYDSKDGLLLAEVSSSSRAAALSLNIAAPVVLAKIRCILYKGIVPGVTRIVKFI